MSIRADKPLELADNLVMQLLSDSENLAELMGGMALAISRLQGYEDYLLLSFDTNLVNISIGEDE